MTNMRTPIALYPYCSDLLAFVKHFEELQDRYCIKEIVSPKGLGICGKDAAYACNHPEIGITVADELDFCSPAWEILLVSISSTMNIDMNNLEDIIKRTLQAGKSVQLYCDVSLLSIDIEKLSHKYPICSNTYTNDTYSLFSIENNHFAPIDLPVILVGGLLKQADVFEVLLCIANRLRTKGVHPLVIAQNKICDMFGFFGISHIFTDMNLSEEQKILEANLFIRKLIHREMPGAILIEAPDAAIRFSNLDPNGFGVLTYMLCQAIVPDFFVCCIPYQLAVCELVDALSADFSLRIGTPIHAVHASNLIVDSSSLLETRKISCVHTSLNNVNDHLKKEAQFANIPFFNVLEEDAIGLYDEINRVLSLW